MAIVKASYTKHASAAKATVRYIAHRPGKDNARITRTLWGMDGTMERVEAYQMIEEAHKGSVFYRFVLNFDAMKEDTHRDIFLRDITEQTMLRLEERLNRTVQWVAATHDDHTPLRHVHILAVLPKKLKVHDFQALREIATASALAQRRERDTIREATLQKERGREAQWELQR